MRIIFLAMLVVLCFCLTYARHIEPVTPKAASYNGPATFIRLQRDNEEDVSTRWLLVCRVNGEEVGFPADAEWIRRAVGSMQAGQAVALQYDLPAKTSTDGCMEMGQPMLREIAPIGAGGTGGLAFHAAGR